MNNTSISGKTRVCGVIGDPIEHTMSPIMHNTAFKYLGIDYVYIPFRVESNGLEKAISGARALGLVGLNVTIPHKVSVIPLLDTLDPLAEKIGAVNTIVNDNGVLKGYNTDATGFLHALLDKGIKPDNKKVAVIGAGGASRAITYILAKNGAELVIFNRPLEMEWAEKLADEISREFNRNTRALELNQENLALELKDSDIMVNATSVGMAPNSDETPVPSILLRYIPVVFDVVYNPVETRLCREAKETGATTISGLDMLVWQGALAFEKWTGYKAPLEMMKKAAVEVLKK